MPGDELFGEGCPAFHSQHGGTVEKNTEDGECEHSGCADLLRIGKSADGVVENEAETEQQHDAGDETAEQAEAAIAVCVAGIALAIRDFVEIPGQTKRDGIRQIVDGVGENSDAIGPESADDFEDSESEIKKKRDFQIVTAAVVIVIGGHELSFSFYLQSLLLEFLVFHPRKLAQCSLFVTMASACSKIGSAVTPVFLGDILMLNCAAARTQQSCSREQEVE